MNPEILTEQDKRLLNPVAPGVITSLIHGAYLFGMTSYSAYVWRKLGVRGFFKPTAVLPLGVLLGGWTATNFVLNEAREMTFSSARSKMVQRYTDQWGSKYLLDVLEPSFRLSEEFDQK